MKGPILETPMAFSEKIAETLGLKLDVVDDLFDVEESKDGFFVARLKPKKFLEKAQFRALCSLTKDLGGEDYIEGAKAWRVKGPLAKVSGGSAEKLPTSLPSSLPKTSPTEVLDEDTEVLRGSAKKIGHLYPILVDSQDNVIDGFHRLKADPTWPKFKVDRVDGPVELEIARLVANTRRDVPAEEKTKGLKLIAEMTGWNPKQIAENIGVKYSWLMKYLPSDFKDQEKAEAGKIGGVESGASRREAEPCLKTQDMTEGKIREILATPKGKEVLASIASETSPTSPLESIPNSDVDSGESIPKFKEKSDKTTSPVTDEVPKTSRASRKAEEIDTGFEWICPECQEKFQLIHIKNVDGKIDHRLEAKY